MTDLTTLSAEELDAQIEALNAEKARRVAEPNPLLVEAREICAQYFEMQDLACVAQDYRSGKNDQEGDDGEHELPIALAALRRGMELQVAAPLIPTPEIDESQIDQIAHRCQFADGIENRTLTPYNAAQRAIRETIRLLGHAPKGGAA